MVISWIKQSFVVINVIFILAYWYIVYPVDVKVALYLFNQNFFLQLVIIVIAAKGFYEKMLIFYLTFQIFHVSIRFHLRNAIKWFIKTWMFIILFIVLILNSDSLPSFDYKLMLIFVKENIFKKFKVITFKKIRYEILIKLFPYIFHNFLSN